MTAISIPSLTFASHRPIVPPVRSVNTVPAPQLARAILPSAHRRTFQTTPAFQERYEDRAGIEGTLSQAVRSHDLRRSRYLGQAKTQLHHLLCAAALNLCRAVDWLNERVRATTRSAAFVRLALAFP